MTTPQTWDHPGPHMLQVVVQDAHIDLMRHTNNIVYLQWVEAVAWEGRVRRMPAEFTQAYSAALVTGALAA